MNACLEWPGITNIGEVPIVWTATNPMSKSPAPVYQTILPAPSQRPRQVTSISSENIQKDVVDENLKSISDPMTPSEGIKTITIVENIADVASLLCKGYGVDACYDYVYLEMDAALQRGDFEEINKGFKSIRVNSYSIDALLALFTITSHANSELPNRGAALNLFEQRISVERPELSRRCSQIR
jgi:hypothetical protein